MARLKTEYTSFKRSNKTEKLFLDRNGDVIRKGEIVQIFHFTTRAGRDLYMYKRVLGTSSYHKDSLVLEDVNSPGVIYTADRKELAREYERFSKDY